MARCIFNCEWNGSTSGQARRPCVYMWDNCFYVGIKVAVLFTKGLHCMYWHALHCSCGPLSCTCFDPPDDSDNQICLTNAFPAIRVTRSQWQDREDTHWQILYVHSGGLGHPRNYAGVKADRHPGQAQQAQRQTWAPTAGFDPLL